MEINILYDYNENTGTSVCTIPYRGRKFIGTAYVHPEDEEWKSEMTGMAIAEHRAVIRMLRHIRDNDAIPSYKAIKHLYTNIQTSKNYEPKSYESRMIKKQYIIAKRKVETLNNLIKQEREDLNNYLESKEKIHKQIKNRINNN